MLSPPVIECEVPAARRRRRAIVTVVVALIVVTVPGVALLGRHWLVWQMPVWVVVAPVVRALLEPTFSRLSIGEGGVSYASLGRSFSVPWADVTAVDGDRLVVRDHRRIRLSLYDRRWHEGGIGEAVERWCPRLLTG